MSLSLALAAASPDWASLSGPGRFPVLVLLDSDGELSGRWRDLCATFPVARRQLRSFVLSPDDLPEFQADLRQRTGWKTEAFWALVDASGAVRLVDRRLPDAEGFVAKLEASGAGFPIGELEAFLRRDPDHREGRLALLGLRCEVAAVFKAPQGQEPPDVRRKREAAQRLAWGEVESDLDGLFRRGDWLPVRYTLAFLLQAHLPEAPVMGPEPIPAWLALLEAELKRMPEDWALWRLWLDLSGQGGGRPLAPLLSGLDLQPLADRWKWPPVAVLEGYCRQASRRKDWASIRAVLEPRWEGDRPPLRPSPIPATAGASLPELSNDWDGGLFSDTRWNRLLPFLIEAQLADGTAAQAGITFQEALSRSDLKPEALSACIQAARARELTRLAREWERMLAAPRSGDNVRP